MIAERHVRAVALFFLFALPDERSAVHAAERVVAALKHRLEGLSQENPDIPVIIIRTCVSRYHQEKKHLNRGARTALGFESGWALPERTSPAPWATFHKDAPEEELLALLLAHVLGFGEPEIARALEVTEGTVRHRVSHAVRRLGAAVRLAV